MRPPQSWQSARATLAIAGVTAAAWLLAALSGQDDLIAVWGGFTPALAGAGSLAAALATPLTATLIHAGLVHLGFNLLMLLFCGRSVETIIGGRGLVILYVVGAYFAAGAQYLAGPHQVVPMVGASGAISAVVGAYAILFGRNRVRVANPQLARLLHALWLAAAWVVLQLMVGIVVGLQGPQVAIAAHIGGFIAGLGLAMPLLLLRWRGA
jgi:membrane associated rhomboid family serine protease